jgi:oligopeptidase A
MTHQNPNPLLNHGTGLDALPAFGAIRPEHVTPALDVLLAQAQAALDLAVGPSVPAEFEALSAVLDVAVERLTSAWGHVSHLQSVADTPALRQAHADNLPRIIDFTTRLGADERLYAKTKAVAHHPAAAALSPTRQKVLADALRDFVLGGAELQGAQRERYAAIQDRAGALSQQFGDHVLDATEAYTWCVPEADLTGVPADVLQTAREAASAAQVSTQQTSCLLTLKAPCYVPVMQYASNRTVRQTLYRAYAIRASELGAPEFDNTALMQELLQLRHEEAALLGHSSYAHLALVPKMAESPAAVLGFVQGLVQRAKPYAQQELAELRSFAAAHLALPDLQPWDRAYASEQLKQQRYAFSGTEVQQYFTEPRVLQGLFDLITELFGVQVREADPTSASSPWHPSVRFYKLYQGSGQDAQAVAGFYLDLHARSGKQGGAWMSEVRSRWLRPGGQLQLPIAHLVCNFAPPVGGKPALLTHDDVITLFHEFGHGLHHMLTQVQDLAVSGIAGVEHDAVELPSQFMENFCWEWPVLQRLTAHVDTGLPLPRELYDRMCAARHFQSGLQLLRQCEFALFDMRVHSEVTAAGAVQALADEVNAQVQPTPSAPFWRYAHSFSHLFDGGYGAGYYGYAWAEVLSADVYAAFEESGVFNPGTGQRYLQTILQMGGSRPALDNFKAFRGREPQQDALLRHQGLAGALPDQTNTNGGATSAGTLSATAA